MHRVCTEPDSMAGPGLELGGQSMMSKQEACYTRMYVSKPLTRPQAVADKVSSGTGPGRVYWGHCCCPAGPGVADCDTVETPLHVAENRSGTVTRRLPLGATPCPWLLGSRLSSRTHINDAVLSSRRKSSAASGDLRKWQAREGAIPLFISTDYRPGITWH